MDTKLFVRKQAGGMFAVIDRGFCPGSVFFVDSSNAKASDAVGFGQNPDAPCATIDYAISLCTADKGDIIYVMPGHAETIEAAAAIACDIEGVSIIGLGNGDNRPTVTLDTGTDTTITVTANNVTLQNLRFINTQDALVVGIAVTGTYCTIEGCEFIDAGADNTVDWITASAAADNLRVLDCRNEGTDTAGNESFISIGATAHVEIRNLTSHGDFAAANIECTAAPTDILITGCHLENKNAVDVCIEGFAAATGWVSHNCLHIATDGEDSGINTGGTLALFENYTVNADAETGMITGTVSTT